MSQKTIEIFQQQKEQSIDIIKKLQSFLEEGLKLNVPIETSLFQKLQVTANSIEDGKLKIALVGGFSEGKTSIAAAWIEKIDKSSMNISHKESSDHVAIYELENNLVLIDTPGLFGFKEKKNPDSQQIEKYKDITKKYVSEAQLVLYVMNSTNPIKESHREDLIWLFKDLNLLSRTVFVLSRFDEVADVADDEDFEDTLQVKKDNIKGRLTDILKLNSQDQEDLLIVAVAANPFDQGIDYWLKNIEEFKKLSHIHLLQNATQKLIARNGGFLPIVYETQKTIIKDVLNRQLPIAESLNRQVNSELTGLLKVAQLTAQEVGELNKQLVEIRTSLRHFITQHMASIIRGVSGSSLETFADFFEEYIGTNGIMLETAIQNEFDKQLNALLASTEIAYNNFSVEVNHFNTAVGKLGHDGIKYAISSKLINKDSVLIARDTIVSLGKTVGLDLSKTLKFKPWGATKFAKGANGLLAGIGLAIEVYSAYKEHEQEDQFRKAKAELIEYLNQHREHVLSIVNAESFKETYFPQIVVMEHEIRDIKQKLEYQKDLNQKFSKWKEQGDVIDAEFSVIE